MTRKQMAWHLPFYPIHAHWKKAGRAADGKPFWLMLDYEQPLTGTDGTGDGRWRGIRNTMAAYRTIEREGNQNPVPIRRPRGPPLAATDLHHIRHHQGDETV